MTLCGSSSSHDQLPGGPEGPPGLQDALPPQLPQNHLWHNVGVLEEERTGAAHVWDAAVETGGLLRPGRDIVRRRQSLLASEPVDSCGGVKSRSSDIPNTKTRHECLLILIKWRIWHFLWGALIWQSGDEAGRRGCDTRRCSLFTGWMHFSAGLSTFRPCSDRDGTKLLPSVVLDQPVLLALRIAHIPSTERMPSNYLKEAERVHVWCKLFVCGSETKCWDEKWFNI